MGFETLPWRVISHALNDFHHCGQSKWNINDLRDVGEISGMSSTRLDQAAQASSITGQIFQEQVPERFQSFRIELSVFFATGIFDDEIIAFPFSAEQQKAIIQKRKNAAFRGFGIKRDIE